MPVPKPPKPVDAVVVAGFVPKAPKAVDVPKVGAVFVPNPLKKEGADVVVVVPNALKPPKLKEDVVLALNVPKPELGLVWYQKWK